MKERFAQIRQAFVATKNVDPKLIPLMAGTAVGVIALAVIIGIITSAPVLWTVLGVMIALLAAQVVFGLRVRAAQFSLIEGQPGAAAAVLQTMRGGWQLQPAVAFTRKQDFVHRAIGPPGVVVIGEGSPGRVATLLKQEHRKAARAAGEVTVHQVSVGDGEGQIPIRQLQAHLSRLPRTLKKPEVAALATRLSALSTADAPLPKGPMPRHKRR